MAIAKDKIRVQLTFKKSAWIIFQELAKMNGTTASVLIENVAMKKIAEDFENYKKNKMGE